MPANSFLARCWMRRKAADLSRDPRFALHSAQTTMLVVEWWTPAHGLRRIERE